MYERSTRNGVAILLLGLLTVAGFVTAQAPRSDTLIIGINQLATSLDPPTDWIVESTWVHMNLFDCLVWRNRDTAEFEPWLAEGWTNVNDTTWRMKLREGITFHNGEPFDAEAVVWTYERIYNAPNGQADFITYNQWTFIEEINVIGPYEVEFVTVDPDPAFLSRMAGTGCGVQAPVAGRAHAEAGTAYEPIGTGPYKLVEFQPDERIVLERNPDYWRGQPEIPVLIWRSVPEAATRVASLLTGELDVIVAVPTQDIPRIESNPDTEAITFFTNRVMLLSLRAGPTEPYPDWSGVTSSVEVRRAIQYAIDRRLLQEVVGPEAVPVLARTFPPTLGWDPEMYDNYGVYDPELARELLAEAGYAGEPVVFHAAPQTPFSADAAEVIAAMLQDVGINVDLRILSTSVFREQVDLPYRNEEIVMNILNNSFFDPWIEVLAARSDRRERSGWTGETADRADELIRAAERNMDPESRAEQIREVNRLMYEEAIVIHLFRIPEQIATTARLDWAPSMDGFLWFGNAAWR